MGTYAVQIAKAKGAEVAGVCSTRNAPFEVREQVVERFGDEVLVELALAIGASRFIPTVKRTLGYSTSCALKQVAVPPRMR